MIVGLLNGPSRTMTNTVSASRNTALYNAVADCYSLVNEEIQMSAPTRIDDDVFEAAQQTGPLQSRSAAQQVNHWARIGRALETAAGVSQRRVTEVLARSRDYDELSDEEQAIVRAEWAERIELTRNRLNLAEEFTAAGRSYVELDADGGIVRRDPAAPTS